MLSIILYLLANAASHVILTKTLYATLWTGRTFATNVKLVQSVHDAAWTGEMDEFQISAFSDCWVCGVVWQIS